VHGYNFATGDFAIVAVEGNKPDATIPIDCDDDEVIIPSVED
jgi:hypothetical protein